MAPGERLRLRLLLIVRMLHISRLFKALRKAAKYLCVYKVKGLEAQTNLSQKAMHRLENVATAWARLMMG